MEPGVERTGGEVLRMQSASCHSMYRRCQSSQNELGKIVDAKETPTRVAISESQG